MEERENKNATPNRSGYPLLPRKKIIEEIMGDEEVIAIINRVAKRNNKPVFLVQRRARKILKEMGADLTPKAVGLACRFFKFIWKKLYTKLHVDFEGLKRAGELIKGNAVILMPSHKSHVDYLLLSSIFHENNIIPPFIAAGVNLSFWPLGYIFRKTGAFFIRRSIGNDILYYKLLFKYISILIRGKVSQEFFIEGGRSRNGKIQSPKMGLLTIEIDAYMEDQSKDLYFLPIAIAYDRVLEEKAYFEELTGGHKVKETFWGVLNSRKVLKMNYGEATLKFGEPISFKNYIAKYGDQRLTPKLKKNLITELASAVIKSINAIMPVTPTALVATSVLSSPKRRITHDELAGRANLFIEYLSHRKVQFSSSFDAREKGLLSGIALFCEAGFLRAKARDGTKYYWMKPVNRVFLDYYKNNIINFFAPLAYLSSCLIRNPNPAETGLLREDFDFLSKLFSAEFVLNGPAESEFEDTLKWLEQEKIVTVTSGETGRLVEICDMNRLEIFSGILKNHIEAYHTTALTVLKIILGELKVSAEGTLATILKIGLRAFKRGNILFRESLTAPYVNNALKFLNRNIIPSFRSVLAHRDLEDEDEIEPNAQESTHESREIDELRKLAEKLESFL